MDIRLRPEEEKDHRLVEDLTREAFWNLYAPGCSEHFILHNMRRTPDFIKELDMVAEMDGQVVGNIVYAKGEIVADNGLKHQVIGFGPVSVLPSFQKHGIGSKLIESTMAAAKEMGFRAVIIFGDPDYYHRFGFDNAQKFNIQTSDGQNFEPFMVKELYEGSLAGIEGRFLLSDVFFNIDEKELEEYDRTFPPKEKKITATQLKNE